MGISTVCAFAGEDITVSCGSVVVLIYRSSVPRLCLFRWKRVIVYLVGGGNVAGLLLRVSGPSAPSRTYIQVSLCCQRTDIFELNDTSSGPRTGRENGAKSRVWTRTERQQRLHSLTSSMLYPRLVG